MNVNELGQLIGFVTLSILCLGGGVLALRLGWAWARRIELKHAAGAQVALQEERLAELDEECGSLRHEVQALAERLDFAERMLANQPAQHRVQPIEQLDALPRRGTSRPVTPH